MRSLAAPSLIAGLLLFGCSKPSGPDTKKIVGRVDGAPITEGELLAEAKAPLAALERKLAEDVHKEKALALDRLVEKRLLLARANKEGIGVEALLDREVSRRVQEPPESALRAVYDQTKANGRVLPPFEDVRGEIAGFLKTQAAESVRRDLASRLRAEAKVESLMPPLLLPKVEFEAKGPSRGDAGAPVTIVEFSDYECEFCGVAEETVRRVLDAYKGRVRLVHQAFPLSIHPRAPKAAEAAFCAGEQGRYWEMHDSLLAKQAALGVDDLKGRARGLQLDAPRFDSCLDSGRMARAVDASRKLGEELGLTATPAFFVNGRFLSGAQPFERFKELVDNELSEARR
jgi:predicted DsbA family dithiol-disulfide isomerase